MTALTHIINMDTADLVDTGERTPNAKGGIYRTEQGGATELVVEKWGGDTNGYMIVKLIMGSHEVKLGQRTFDHRTQPDNVETAREIAAEIVERFMYELSGAPKPEGVELARAIIAESIRATGGGFRASYIEQQAELSADEAQAVIDEFVAAGELAPHYAIACINCSSIAVSTSDYDALPFGQVIECPFSCDEGYSESDGASVFEVWDKGSQRVEVSYRAVKAAA